MYDIFISAKNLDKGGLPTRDSIIAQELYEFLSSKNLKVFFSKVSLENLGETNFKKMIDDALDSANIVIAVGTSHENLNSKWVRYEWDSFLTDILSDVKKQGQVFCYGENIGISDLPRGLRQSQFFIHNPKSMLSLYNFINKYLTSIKDKNEMDYIFISYAREDQKKAHEIAEAIEQNGYTVFWDRNIEIGESWDKFIEKKLAAAKCVVVLWSEKSIESDWVKEEADEGKKKSFLVQVLIDNVTPPFGFRRKQAANLVGWDGTSFYPEFVLLLKYFSKLLGPPHVDKTENLKEGEGSKEEKLTLKAKDTPVLNKTIYECMKERMIEIPAPEDKFTMGDDFEVIISHPFLMDKYLVTQDLYKEVMKKNPSYFRELKDFPVENVSWFDAIEFCNKLSKQTGLECVYDDKDKKNVEINYKKSGYRLPTEAEWEYACCRGTTEELYINLDDIAWYNKNSGKQTHGVGGKDAIFDIFDMLGNVWEWCNDWYEEYPKGLQEDPIGPKDGYMRSLRGGSWVNTRTLIRPDYRERKNPFSRHNNQGIRLVRSLNQHVAKEF